MAPWPSFRRSRARWCSRTEPAPAGATSRSGLVYALDLPGHGHSDIPAAEYTADFFIETIAGFLQQLEIEKAVLVGESIGATAALGLDGRRRSPASSSRSTRCPRSAER
jgi:pimeloyl-ACP methyl ester carboxylesterase